MLYLYYIIMMEFAFILPKNNLILDANIRAFGNQESFGKVSNGQVLSLNYSHFYFKLINR